VDSFGGKSPKAGEQDTHLSFKLDTMMEGIENDDLSLQPVEQEYFPTNHILMMMKILMDGRQ